MEKNDIKKLILTTVAGAGLVALAVLVPNALQSLKLFGLGKKKYYPSHIREVVNRLELIGFIKLERSDRGIFIRLTTRGEKVLAGYQSAEGMIKKDQRWDRKWRIIIFDVKEYRRKTRDQLRRELANFGFHRLQNSVWVFPYHCEEFIVLLKADLRIGKDVLFITAENIENDRQLREQFGLLK